MKISMPFIIERYLVIDQLIITEFSEDATEVPKNFVKNTRVRTNRVKTIRCVMTKVLGSVRASDLLDCLRTVKRGCVGE